MISHYTEIEYSSHDFLLRIETRFTVWQPFLRVFSLAPEMFLKMVEFTS